MAPGHLARLRLAKESKVGGAAASSQLPASPRQLLTRKLELHLACISHISISQIQATGQSSVTSCHQAATLPSPVQDPSGCIWSQIESLWQLQPA